MKSTSNLCSSQSRSTCDTTNNVINLKTSLLVVLMTLNLQYLNQVKASSQQQHQQAALNNEFQLIGQSSGEVRLPCLIGKQLYCGEVYFIAWYKLNSTSGRQWTRIEHKTRNAIEDEEDSSKQQLQNTYEDNNNQQQQTSSSSSSSSLNDRVQFVWTPGKQNNRAACLADTTQSSSQRLINQAAQFDCAQLVIKRLELADEGQYKCEITFSESIDFEKCPSNTMTQLNVIARPNEPEILVNGRPVHQTLASTSSSSNNSQQLTFKEGSQVRLECQSGGGKPAPRIEWLNLTTLGAFSELQLMRMHWPVLRRLTTSAAGADNSISMGASSTVPVTSSALTVTLSRFDLKSRFICLVLPHQTTTTTTSNPNQYELLLPPNLRQPRQLNDLLDQIPMLANSRSSNEIGFQMLKWIKFDVLAKPSSVSIQIRDLDSNSLVLPSTTATTSSLNQVNSAPFYSLEPNKLYAIQCVIDNSRPRSQVNWFNRTNLINLEADQTVKLDAQDYLLPSMSLGANKTRKQAQLTSFTRYIEQPNGLYRTVASLLLRTSFWNNLEEIFCRIQNEAFKFDELNQVAPIQAAKLHINYPPSAWIDWQPEVGQVQEADEEDQEEEEEQEVDEGRRPEASSLIRLKFQLNERLHLRCHLAANPFQSDAIIQFDWFRDGRLIVVGPAGNSTWSSSSSSLGQPGAKFLASSSALRLEKTNHLHMVNQADQEQLELGAHPAQTSRLLVSSSLIVNRLTREDAATYSCQFKLIPTKLAAGVGQTRGASGGGQPTSSGPTNKILSGQAGQLIKVTLGQAKQRGPIVRVASSEGLFVYGKQQHDQRAVLLLGHLNNEQQQQQQRLSLRCDMKRKWKQPPPGPANIEHHKVFWYLNGMFLSSSSSSDSFNLTLRDLIPSTTTTDNSDLDTNFRLTCAVHLFEPSAILSSPNEFHSSQAVRKFYSLNELNLKLKVSPHLIANNNRLVASLMPQVRTFSELELVSQPKGKLKLTCQARCEPLCSIDWHLNNERLVKPKIATNQAQLQINHTKSTIFVVSRSSQVTNNNNNDDEWLIIDNLIEQNTTSEESAGLTWIKQSKIQAAKLTSTSGELETTSLQLNQEMQPIQQAKQANVFSQLELSYAQINRMLEQQQQFSIECRLNPNFNQDNLFRYKQVAPNEWFPQSAAEQELEGFDEVPVDFESIISTDKPTKRPQGGPSIQSMKTTIKLDRALKVDLAPPIKMNEQFSPPGGPEQQVNRSLLSIGGNSSSLIELTGQHQQHSFAPLVRNWLTSRLDVILILSCSIALIYLLTIMVSSFIRRHYSSCYPPNKFHLSSGSGSSKTKSMNRNRTNNWKLGSTNGTNDDMIGVGRLTSNGLLFKHSSDINCPNYYGDSNHSELDIVQSCSQSSHYEDFVHHQLRQHQPIYFNQQPLSTPTNSGSTLSRRPLMKTSLSSTSTNNGLMSTAANTIGRMQVSQASVHNQQSQRVIYGQHPSFASSTTRGNDLVNARHDNMTPITSNIPLINGANNTTSRINLDRPTNIYKQQLQQPNFEHNNHGHHQEHIYDDVIYNQMIL